MKTNKYYLIGTMAAFAIFPVITFLFFRGNSDAHGYADKYIADSKIVRLRFLGVVECCMILL